MENNNRILHAICSALEGLVAKYHRPLHIAGLHWVSSVIRVAVSTSTASMFNIEIPHILQSCAGGDRKQAHCHYLIRNCIFTFYTEEL